MEEFSLLHENAEEWALPWSSPPAVERVAVPIGGGRHLSALRWGQGAPGLVLLRGGGQNAHTFDTVALALARPLIALDLPSHGHADEAPGGLLDAEGHAHDVLAALGALGLAHLPLVGMSLGGFVAILVAAHAPEVASRVALIDVTPGALARRGFRPTTWPQPAESLDALVDEARELAPSRPEAALRRGVVHNTVQRADGTWVWRYARFDPPEAPRQPDAATLWTALESLTVPVLLVRGTGAGSLLIDEDEDELRRRVAGATVVRIDDAGHAVQSDQPTALAAVLAGFIDEP